MTPFERFRAQVLIIITEALERARAADTCWSKLLL
jgi:hypothetical protein